MSKKSGGTRDMLQETDTLSETQCYPLYNVRIQIFEKERRVIETSRE